MERLVAEAEIRLREAEEKLKPEPLVIRTFRDALNPEDERLKGRGVSIHP